MRLQAPELQVELTMEKQQHIRLWLYANLSGEGREGRPINRRVRCSDLIALDSVGDTQTYWCYYRWRGGFARFMFDWNKPLIESEGTLGDLIEDVMRADRITYVAEDDGKKPLLSAPEYAIPCLVFDE